MLLTMSTFFWKSWWRGRFQQCQPHSWHPEKSQTHGSTSQPLTSSPSPVQSYHKVINQSVSHAVIQGWWELTSGCLSAPTADIQLSIPALWQLPHYFSLLRPVPTGEAIHLGSLIAAQGYVFPISDHVLTLKDDSTFYRFQVGPPVPPPREPFLLVTLWSRFRTAYKYWGHWREQRLPPTSSGKTEKTFVWAIYCFTQTIQKSPHGELTIYWAIYPYFLIYSEEQASRGQMSQMGKLRCSEN